MVILSRAHCETRLLKGLKYFVCIIQMHHAKPVNYNWFMKRSCQILVLFGIGKKEIQIEVGLVGVRRNCCVKSAESECQ